jgi:SGNH hydrolase-like domain, acetyltransferase AlgX
MLFQLDDVQNGAPEGPRLWAQYFQALDQGLRARNFRLLVVLVPSEYTVYQPLIEGAIATNKDEQLEQLLRQLPGIPAVNTTPALQQAAVDALANGQLLYWRDDTHGNGNGVRVAADQVGALYASRRKLRDLPRVEPVSQTRIH